MTSNEAVSEATKNSAGQLLNYSLTAEYHLISGNLNLQPDKEWLSQQEEWLRVQQQKVQQYLHLPEISNQGTEKHQNSGMAGGILENVPQVTSKYKEDGAQLEQKGDHMKTNMVPSHVLANQENSINYQASLNSGFAQMNHHPTIGPESHHSRERKIEKLCSTNAPSQGQENGIIVPKESLCQNSAGTQQFQFTLPGTNQSDALPKENTETRLPSQELNEKSELVIPQQFPDQMVNQSNYASSSSDQQKISLPSDLPKTSCNIENELETKSQLHPAILNSQGDVNKKPAGPKRKRRRKIKEEVNEKAIFQCLECIRKFTSESHMRYHLKCHTEEEGKYLCPECPTSFKSWKPLQWHLWVHHKIDIDMIVCSLCGHKTISRPTLNIHLSRKHKIIIPSDGTEKPKKKKAKSSQSNVSQSVDASAINNNLDSEALKDAFQYDSPSIIQKKSLSNRVMYSCPRCSFGTLKLSRYTLHQLKRHKTLNCFYCPLCIYNIKSHKEFSSHMRNHEKVMRKRAAEENGSGELYPYEIPPILQFIPSEEGLQEKLVVALDPSEISLNIDLVPVKSSRPPKRKFAMMPAKSVCDNKKRKLYRKVVSGPPTVKIIRDKYPHRVVVPLNPQEFKPDSDDDDDDNSVELELLEECEEIHTEFDPFMTYEDGIAVWNIFSPHVEDLELLLESSEPDIFNVESGEHLDDIYDMMENANLFDDNQSDLISATDYLPQNFLDEMGDPLMIQDSLFLQNDSVTNTISGVMNSVPSDNYMTKNQSKSYDLSMKENLFPFSKNTPSPSSQSNSSFADSYSSVLDKDTVSQLNFSFFSNEKNSEHSTNNFKENVFHHNNYYLPNLKDNAVDTLDNLAINFDESQISSYGEDNQLLFEDNTEQIPDLTEMHPCTALYCRYTFKSKNGLMYHLRCHNIQDRNFVCPDCRHKELNWCDMSDHLWKVHCLYMDEQVYSCEVCGSIFSLVNQLMDHLKTHNENADVTWCSKCQKSISNAEWSSHLKMHEYNCVVTEDPDGHSKTFCCTKCEFKTCKDLDFHLHMLQHTNKITCFHCSFKTKSVQTYEYHYQINHTVKVCSYCCLRFIDQFTFDNHLREQHGDKYQEVRDNSIKKQKAVFNKNEKTKKIKERIILPKSDTSAKQSNFYDGMQLNSENVKSDGKHFILKSLLIPESKQDVILSGQTNLCQSPQQVTHATVENNTENRSYPMITNNFNHNFNSNYQQQQQIQYGHHLPKETLNMQNRNQSVIVKPEEFKVNKTPATYSKSFSSNNKQFLRAPAFQKDNEQQPTRRNDYSVHNLLNNSSSNSTKVIPSEALNGNQSSSSYLYSQTNPNTQNHSWPDSNVTGNNAYSPAHLPGNENRKEHYHNSQFNTNSNNNTDIIRLNPHNQDLYKNESMFQPPGMKAVQGFPSYEKTSELRNDLDNHKNNVLNSANPSNKVLSILKQGIIEKQLNFNRSESYPPSSSANEINFANPGFRKIDNSSVSQQPSYNIPPPYSFHLPKYVPNSLQNATNTRFASESLPPHLPPPYSYTPRIPNEELYHRQQFLMPSHSSSGAQNSSSRTSGDKKSSFTKPYISDDAVKTQNNQAISTNPLPTNIPERSPHQNQQFSYSSSSFPEADINFQTRTQTFAPPVFGPSDQPRPSLYSSQPFQFDHWKLKPPVPNSVIRTRDPNIQNQDSCHSQGLIDYQKPYRFPNDPGLSTQQIPGSTDNRQNLFHRFPERESTHHTSPSVGQQLPHQHPVYNQNHYIPSAMQNSQQPFFRPTSISQSTDKQHFSRIPGGPPLPGMQSIRPTSEMHSSANHQQIQPFKIPYQIPQSNSSVSTSNSVIANTPFYQPPDIPRSPQGSPAQNFRPQTHLENRFENPLQANPVATVSGKHSEHSFQRPPTVTHYLPPQYSLPSALPSQTSSFRLPPPSQSPQNFRYQDIGPTLGDPHASNLQLPPPQYLSRSPYQPQPVKIAMPFSGPTYSPLSNKDFSSIAESQVAPTYEPAFKTYAPPTNTNPHQTQFFPNLDETRKADMSSLRYSNHLASNNQIPFQPHSLTNNQFIPSITDVQKPAISSHSFSEHSKQNSLKSSIPISHSTSENASTRPPSTSCQEKTYKEIKPKNEISIKYQEEKSIIQSSSHHDKSKSSSIVPEKTVIKTEDDHLKVAEMIDKSLQRFVMMHSPEFEKYDKMKTFTNSCTDLLQDNINMSPKSHSELENSHKIVKNTSPRHVINTSPRNVINTSPRNVTNPSPRNVMNTPPRNINSSPRNVANSSPRNVANSSPRNIANSSPRNVANSSPRNIVDSSLRNIANTSPRVSGNTSPRNITNTSPGNVINNPSSITSSSEQKSGRVTKRINKNTEVKSKSFISGIPSTESVHSKSSSKSNRNVGIGKHLNDHSSANPDNVRPESPQQIYTSQKKQLMVSSTSDIANSLPNVEDSIVYMYVQSNNSNSHETVQLVPSQNSAQLLPPQDTLQLLPSQRLEQQSQDNMQILPKKESVQIFPSDENYILYMNLPVNSNQTSNLVNSKANLISSKIVSPDERTALPYIVLDDNKAVSKTVSSTKAVNQQSFFMTDSNPLEEDGTPYCHLIDEVVETIDSEANEIEEEVIVHEIFEQVHSKTKEHTFMISSTQSLKEGKELKKIKKTDSNLFVIN